MARPTLPRIRRGRARGEAGQVVERTEPRIAELSANGLTWIHINEPGPLEAAYLAERYGFHELDIEDVLSKRQRPKIDEYPEYLFIVLHFPIYDKTVQRLNAAELDVFLGQDFLITLANVELLPVTYLFRRCEEDDELRDELFSKALGLPALPRPRRPLRLLLPDPGQDRAQAGRDRGRARGAPQRGDRPRHLRREAGDHRVPQDHQARARDPAPARAPHAALPPAGPRALLRRHRRRGRAHLGPPRQLQGGRRGARGHERVDHLAPAAVPAPASHRRQRDPAAAHADREHLRDEHARPRRGRRRGRSGSWSG